MSRYDDDTYAMADNEPAPSHDEILARNARIELHRALRIRKGRPACRTVYTRVDPHGPRGWRQMHALFEDPLHAMAQHRRKATRLDPFDIHSETRAEEYWKARKAAMYPRASRLRLTDMLAMTTMCATEFQKLRATWRGRV